MGSPVCGIVRYEFFLSGKKRIKVGRIVKTRLNVEEPFLLLVREVQKFKLKPTRVGSDYAKPSPSVGRKNDKCLLM